MHICFLWSISLLKSKWAYLCVNITHSFGAFSNTDFMVLRAVDKLKGLSLPDLGEALLILKLMSTSSTFLQEHWFKSCCCSYYCILGCHILCPKLSPLLPSNWESSGPVSAQSLDMTLDYMSEVTRLHTQIYLLWSSDNFFRIQVQDWRKNKPTNNRG